MSLSQSLANVPLALASAPPASSARLLAQAFGASCALRFSSRSYSGLVLVARFGSAGAACRFAPLAVRLAGGVAVKVRGVAVSVPVAPWSQRRNPSPRQVIAQVAAILRQPAPPPGGQCAAYTRQRSAVQPPGQTRPLLRPARQVGVSFWPGRSGGLRGGG